MAAEIIARAWSDERNGRFHNSLSTFARSSINQLAITIS